MRLLFVGLFFILFSATLLRAEPEAFEAPFRRPVDAYDNPVKEAIKNNQMSYGGFLMSNSLENAANLTRQTHFLWIDAEHSPFSPADVYRLVEATHLKTTAIPVVRVPRSAKDRELPFLKQYLDTGVLGVVIPEVETADEVRGFLQSLKYPPLGNRGLGPARSTQWLADVATAVKRANDSILTIVMIETPLAVKNIEAIASVEGVDILHIGPYDLTLKTAGQMKLPADDARVKDEVARSIALVEETAVKHRLALGGLTLSRADAFQKYRRGYRFLTIGSDQEFIQAGIRNFYTGPIPAR